MTRQAIVQYAREYMNANGLNDWSVVLNTEPTCGYHGLCDYNSKTIILSAYSMEFLHEEEAKDTVRHEVCHALVGANHGHDDVWRAECDKHNVRKVLCTKPSVPEHIIDASRSGHLVTVDYEIKRIPKYTVTQLKDKCPECGKVAKELFAVEHMNSRGEQCKLITLECFHIITKVTPRGTPFEEMISNGWDERVKNCKHDWDKHQCKVCKEYRLMNFQLESARAVEVGLTNQKGFGVFHEMGLGKTVIALAHIKYHAKNATPTLYIVKSAIKFQWFKEIIRWLGPDYLAQIISTSRDYLIPGLKSYIISYDLLRRFPREKIEKLGIKLVVLDECQQIKNPDSTRTQEVRKIVGNPSCKVIPLSGTPWKNRGGEFFPVLNMIDPIKFHSYQGYLDTHVEFYYKGNQRKMGGFKNPKKFREYVKDLLIRREFDEVIEDYPTVNRTKLPVQLDALNQTTYNEATSEFVKWYNEAIISGTEESLNGLEILAKLAKMRHITGLAKIPATLQFLETFIEETDKKIVVFVHHQDVGVLMLNALQDTNKKTNPDWHELAQTLKTEGIKVMQLRAGLDDGVKFSMQEEFNATKRVIMIASTLSAGEGINLQTCSDAIMHERQWNPSNEDQAAPGRFKRIGQVEKLITVTFPEGEGTVDEFMSDLVEGKRGAFHDTMNTTESVKWDEGEIGKQLAKMIVGKFNSKRPQTHAAEILMKSKTA